MPSTTKPGAKRGPLFRRWARIIHRDLSYFFAGVVVVYAVSGIVLNHKRDFNSNYSVRRTELQMPGVYPAPAETSREQAEELLRTADPEARYAKHYVSGEHRVKVFVAGGSVLEVDMQNGRAVYEKLTKRPVISSMNRLHYNPSRWWTRFSRPVRRIAAHHHAHGAGDGPGPQRTAGPRRHRTRSGYCRADTVPALPVKQTNAKRGRSFDTTAPAYFQVRGAYTPACVTFMRNNSLSFSPTRITSNLRSAPVLFSETA